MKAAPGLTETATNYWTAKKHLLNGFTKRFVSDECGQLLVDHFKEILDVVTPQGQGLPDKKRQSPSTFRAPASDIKCRAPSPSPAPKP